MMAKVDPVGSCDVLFPEDSYEDYYNPVSHRRSYPAIPETSDYVPSSELQHVFKGEGWSGKNDYAVIPPSSKRRSKKRPDSGHYASTSATTEQNVVRATPAVAIHHSQNSYSQPRNAVHRRVNTIERGHSFSQNYRNSYETLDSREHEKRSPERRYSLREIDTVPYSPNKRNSYSDAHSARVPHFIEKNYLPLSEIDGNNSFENAYGDDPTLAINNSRGSLNNSSSRSSSSSNSNNNNNTVKDNYANPYRKRVSVPEDDFHWRRRTWSPSNQNAELVRDNMGVGSSFQKRNRCYRSNDQLEADMGPVYEDITDHMKDKCPPKITPISGKLSQSQDQVVLRPIAFKPVLPRPNSYVCTPTQSGGEDSGSRPASVKSTNQDGGYKSTSHDDGYISQGSHSASIVSQVSVASVASLHMECSEASVSVSFVNGDCNRSCDRPESHNSSGVSRASSNHVNGYIETPSPSDSGVGELETMLREKDTEIQFLRETMEHNERVIFQVSEEKFRVWQLEMQDLSADFQRRLKAQQQKTFKMEQSFMIQIYKLQQEKRKLQDDYQALNDAKETASSQLVRISEDLKTAAVQRDEANAIVNEKCGEIKSLNSQLAEAEKHAAATDRDIVVLKSQLSKAQEMMAAKEMSLKQLTDELLCAQEQLKGSQARPKTKESVVQTDPLREPLGAKGQRSKSVDLEMSQLQHELESRNREIKRERERFETERQQWLDEKDKVIQYQKQLQANYLQSMRKNEGLEAELGRLNGQLERMDLNMFGTRQSGNREESLC